MSDDLVDLVESPDTCEETTEYGNQKTGSLEADLRQETPNLDSENKWKNLEREFARYEQNHRARRIRELTSSPRKRGGRRRPDRR